MGKRTKVLRAPEAAKLLLSLLPLLRGAEDGEIAGDELHDGLAATHRVSDAIKAESLEPLMGANSPIKAILARRIYAFAMTAGSDAKRIIARIPPNVDERAPLFAAMHALCHQAGFDYVGRLRDMRWESESPASHRLLARRRR